MQNCTGNAGTKTGAFFNPAASQFFKTKQLTGAP
jgi:hypothetical protein